jgi:hypothetical protein
MKIEDNIRRDNRKALKPFLLICLGAAIFGALLGVAIAVLGNEDIPIRDTLQHLLALVCPWLTVAVTLVCLPITLHYYNGGKRLFAGWDGEDEEVIDRADHQLSLALVASNVHMVLLFLFAGVAMILLLWQANQYTLLTLGAFILGIVTVTLCQQKIVDLIRRMNPEKQGSVYQVDFHKKWYASCDEAEQKKIGQSAYKSFSIMNLAFPIAWLAALLVGFIISGDVFPVILVSVLWLVGSISYQREAIRLEQPKDS